MPSYAGIHWASVLQVELRGLFANAQEELLKALQARNAREEGMPAYEQLYAAVAEAQVSANKSLPALDRLLQCCRFGRSFRPQSSEVGTSPLCSGLCASLPLLRSWGERTV
jgi:hypothetical protein